MIFSFFIIPGNPLNRACNIGFLAKNVFNPLTLLIILFFQTLYFPAISQNLDKAEKHKVEAIYKKVELEKGALDEDGRKIDFIYKPKDLEKGKYKVQIEDQNGDLYHILDSQLYIKFYRYFGYTGYGKKGILKVEYYDTYFYEVE